MTTERTQNVTLDLIHPGEAAAMLKVAVRSLARMAERGDIESITLPSGHRRYHREEIQALATGTHSPASKRVAS